MVRSRTSKLFCLLVFTWLGADLVRARSQATPKRQSEDQPTAAAGTASTPSQKVTVLMPEEGTVVHPGDKVHVEVSPLPGVVVDGMVLIGPLGLSEEMRERPPYSFTIRIPTEETSSGHLIGKHGIHVWGGRKGENSDSLGEINVDVEMPDLPVKLEFFYMAVLLPDDILEFDKIGEERYLEVIGTFADEKELDLKESTYLGLTSTNPSVVRVFDHGMVVPVGPGKGNLVATYSLGDKKTRVIAPVKVEAAANSLVPAPWIVDFGDVAEGSSSEPKAVTLTNRSDSSLRISKIELGGVFSGTHDCADISLRPQGGSCTLTVTFSPNRTVLERGKAVVTTSDRREINVFLIGKGI